MYYFYSYVYITFIHMHYFYSIPSSINLIEMPPAPKGDRQSRKTGTSK